MNIRSVCLLGGSGFLGRHLAEILTARGIAVRVPTRNRERAKDTLILLPTVEVLRTDIHDPRALGEVVQGCDAVVNLVGILHDSPSRGFRETHAQLPARIVSACRDAAVPRLVHVSALGASESGASAYLRSKAEGEIEIARAEDHGIATTVFRPSVMFGRGDRFLAMFAELAALFPVLPLGRPDARFQPVFVEDVAHAIASCLDDPACRARRYELCGPTVYTLRQLVQYSADLRGLHRTVIGLPDSLASLQALVLEHLPGRLLSRDNLKSMQTDNVCGCAFPAVFGLTPTPLEAVAPLYIGQRTSRMRYNGLRSRARR